MEILNYIAGLSWHHLFVYTFCGILFAIISTGIIAGLIFFGCWVWGIIDDSNMDQAYKGLNKLLPPKGWEPHYLDHDEARREGLEFLEEGFNRIYGYYKRPMDYDITVDFTCHTTLVMFVIFMLPVLYYHLLTPTIILAILVGLVFIARLARRTQKMLNNHVADKEAHNV